MERKMTMELTEIADPQDETESADVTKKQGSGQSNPLISLDSEILGDVEVRLTAMLGEGRITVGQLLSLSEGSVIELETPLDGRINMSLNGKLIAKGEIVAVGDRFGVRITHLTVSKP